jgi:serine phosphatase RsbU (regulator of sigma subunit)
MEIKFGVAKIGKYATSESGDTLEMIERPHGGLSFVLVDGQRSGKSAKAISNVVARKAIQLLSEGVRDGAAARAAHDYLFTYRGGKVSATLNMLSVDIITKTLVIARNNPSPVIVHTPADGLYRLDQPSLAVGVNRNTKPVMTEIPLAPQTVVVIFTDGLQHAGSMSGGSRQLDPFTAVQTLLIANEYDPQHIADSLLDQAYQLDDGRPRDDISVLVCSVLKKSGDDIRRMSVRLPLG